MRSHHWCLSGQSQTMRVSSEASNTSLMMWGFFSLPVPACLLPPGSCLPVPSPHQWLYLSPCAQSAPLCGWTTWQELPSQVLALEKTASVIVCRGKHCCLLLVVFFGVGALPKWATLWQSGDVLRWGAMTGFLLQDVLVKVILAMAYLSDPDIGNVGGHKQTLWCIFMHLPQAKQATCLLFLGFWEGEAINYVGMFGHPYKYTAEYYWVSAPVPSYESLMWLDMHYRLLQTPQGRSCSYFRLSATFRKLSCEQQCRIFCVSQVLKYQN